MRNSLEVAITYWTVEGFFKDGKTIPRTNIFAWRRTLKNTDMGTAIRNKMLANPSAKMPKMSGGFTNITFIIAWHLNLSTTWERNALPESIFFTLNMVFNLKEVKLTQCLHLCDISQQQSWFCVVLDKPEIKEPSTSEWERPTLNKHIKMLISHSYFNFSSSVLLIIIIRTVLFYLVGLYMLLLHALAISQVLRNSFTHLFSYLEAIYNYFHYP